MIPTSIKEAFPHVKNPQLLNYLEWVAEREDLTMGCDLWGNSIPFLPPSDVISDLILMCEDLYKDYQTLQSDNSSLNSENIKLRARLNSLTEQLQGLTHSYTLQREAHQP
jgi:hypothetical protein